MIRLWLVIAAGADLQYVGFLAPCLNVADAIRMVAAYADECGLQLLPERGVEAMPEGPVVDLRAWLQAKDVRASAR